MFRMLHGIFKWAVIGVVVIVVMGTLVGRDRVKNALLSVRDHLRSNVDDLVDTRVALRAEIRTLEKEYPERIADLRCQLAEVEKDIAGCGDDHRLCEEVVTLCDGDVAVLRGRLEARDADADGLGEAVVEFRSERLPRSDALLRAGRIAETAESYRARLAELDRERQHLSRERLQLSTDLAETEREYRQFQAEIGTMLRELDSLKRKEELIARAERQRDAAGDSYSIRASALENIQTRIEKKKIELTERLDGYRSLRSGNEYEARARLNLVDHR